LLVAPSSEAFADSTANSGGALAANPGYTPTPAEAALDATKIAEAATQFTQPSVLRGFAKPFSTGVHYKYLPLTFQAQSTNYYCVPASGRAMLTSFTSPLPTQATVASRMGTTTNGTYMNYAPAALNYWAGAFYVYDTNVGTAANLFSRTTSDVTSYNAALMLRMEFGHTPWRNTGDTSGHAVVDYGWYTDSANGVQDIYFWDPWDSSKHTAGYSISFTDLGIGGFEMVW
jgi:hypothetical protein